MSSKVGPNTKPPSGSHDISGSRLSIKYDDQAVEVENVGGVPVVCTVF